MKKTLHVLLLALFFWGGSAVLKAQNKTLANSFVLLNNKFPDKADFYKKSIEAADMEQYRLRDKRVHLEFENGFEVELYSAKELFVNGQGLNLNQYEINPHGQVPVFNILPSGHLTAKVFNEQKK